MNPRRSTLATTFTAVVVGALALAPAASATEVEVPVVAACTKGSTISLAATPSAGNLSITMVVDGGGAYHLWVLGIGDNLTGVYGGVRMANSAGDLSVSRGTADQAGTDNIGASAVNLRTGEVCVATLPVSS